MNRVDILIGPGEEGRRLDEVVALAPELSRTKARKLIQFGSVWVNGRRTKIAGRRILKGQRVTVYIADLPQGPPPDLIGRILHLDEHLAVIDKPAGLPTAPTPATDVWTVPALLKQQLHLPRPPSPVHRIDRDTTGVLVLARTKHALKLLTECQMQGRVTRKYLAVATGRPEPPEGEWTWPLARNPRRPDLWQVDEVRGKPARTKYKVLDRIASDPRLWLLELELLTGRTHQIRVHMAQAGVPVLGDPWYGSPSPDRVMYLHSWVWAGDIQGRPLHFQAEPPWQQFVTQSSAAAPSERAESPP